MSVRMNSSSSPRNEPRSCYKCGEQEAELFLPNCWKNTCRNLLCGKCMENSVFCTSCKRTCCDLLFCPYGRQCDLCHDAEVCKECCQRQWICEKCRFDYHGEAGKSQIHINEDRCQACDSGDEDSVQMDTLDFWAWEEMDPGDCEYYEPWERNEYEPWGSAVFGPSPERKQCALTDFWVPAAK